MLVGWGGVGVLRRAGLVISRSAEESCADALREPTMWVGRRGVAVLGLGLEKNRGVCMHFCWVWRFPCGALWLRETLVVLQYGRRGGRGYAI